MAKSNILFITNAKHYGGVEYHRMIIPHVHIANKYKKDFEVSMIDSIDNFEDSFLKQFQAVVFSRMVHHDKSSEILSRLNNLGIVSIVDIDDYWRLPSDHLLYNDYKERGVTKQIIDSLFGADHVTTTTPILADYIKFINKNVTVLENAIDPEQTQFQQNKIESPLIRFGWIGGICHYEDINILKSSFKNIHSDRTIIGKYQLILGGFNLDQKETIINNQGELSVNYLPNERQEFVKFERIFTDDYRGLNNYIYAQALMNFIPLIDEPLSKWESYKRVWGRKVDYYANIYNEIDVALIPLKESIFNSCKSQLKVIEAGFMKKAAIVSNVKPYTIDIDPTNCIQIDPNKNHSGWHKSIKALIKDPSRIEELGNNLYESVKVKYHIDTVGEKRKDLYKKLIDERNSDSYGSNIVEQPIHYNN